MPAITTDNPLELPRLDVIAAGDRPRSIVRISTAPRGFEGEGFPVHRAFQGATLEELDPFIHMDQMGEVDYGPGEPKGTPWHPHRGFETVTYMLSGRFEHRDSYGHAGKIEAGDVQWMTAGRGVIHSEIPQQEEGVMEGFQLWLNLPGSEKMSAPWYRDFAASELPCFVNDSGVNAIVIAGASHGVAGAVTRDATAPAVTSFTSAQSTPTSATSFTFSLVFSEAVSGVAAGDFSNTGSASGCVFAPRWPRPTRSRTSSRRTRRLSASITPGCRATPATRSRRAR